MRRHWQSTTPAAPCQHLNHTHPRSAAKRCTNSSALRAPCLGWLPRCHAALPASRWPPTGSGSLSQCRYRPDPYSTHQSSIASFHRLVSCEAPLSAGCREPGLTPVGKSETTFTQFQKQAAAVNTPACCLVLYSRRSAGFHFSDKVIFVAFIARWIGLGNATQRIGHLSQMIDQVLTTVEGSQLCVGDWFANV